MHSDDRWRLARRLAEHSFRGKSRVPTFRQKSCGGRELPIGTRGRATGDLTVPARGRCRFFCAAIAALTLRVLDPYGHGRLVLLEVNYTEDHHSNFIYLIAVILGVVGVCPASSYQPRIRE